MNRTVVFEKRENALHDYFHFKPYISYRLSYAGGRSGIPGPSPIAETEIVGVVGNGSPKPIPY